MSKREEYFASWDGDELSGELFERLKDRVDGFEQDGLKQKFLRAYRYYYGRHFASSGEGFSESEILRMGEDGELAAFSVNHFRNVIRHVLTLTTSQRPAFDVRATNTDIESLTQAKLGKNILESYLSEKRLGRYLKAAAEQALIFGQGFVKIDWERDLGKEYAVKKIKDDNGETRSQVVYDGDVSVCAPTVFDVYFDHNQDDWDKQQWVVVRSFKNKYDLAAAYPDKRNEILGISGSSDGNGWRYINFKDIDDSEFIPVYEFYHKRTPALPSGRYMMFADNDLVLFDSPMPYKELPVFRIVPGEIFGSPEGYSDAFDLLGPQEALNTLISSVFSNQNAFAVQSVLVPSGSNITAEQISGGLNFIKYDATPQGGKPEALQLTASPPEVFNMIALLERTMETLSGVNSVARGNPDSSLKSGVALSLVQSMAVQFNSAFQEAWANLLEDSGTFILSLLKDFATTRRMVAMAGKHNRGHLEMFTKDDLSNVDRVVVDLGNPMTRTTAGKTAIAESLLEKGLINTPQEFLTVMNTGTLDPLTEGTESEIFLIRRENDRLIRGKKPTAIVGDAHLLHMQEHKALLANPEVRENDEMVAQVLEHIQEHMQLYKQQDPLWSAVSGEPPAPPQPQQPVPSDFDSAPPVAEMQAPNQLEPVDRPVGSPVVPPAPVEV